MTDLLWISVDFDRIDEDGYVLARVERASRTVLEGEDVLALDRAGNECLGQVERVEGGNIYLDLNWSTWIDEAERTAADLFHEVPTHVESNGRAEAESESAPPEFSPLSVA